MSNNDKLIHALLDYQMLVKDQEKRIMRLANSLYLDQENESRKLVNDFAIENEEIYLKLKRLVYDMQGKQTGNRHEMIGKTDAFPSSLEEIDKGIWKFHLPPFYSVNISDRGPTNAGKHIFYLILNLEADYEVNFRKIRKIESPIILFEHHICTSQQKVFDFDNVDSKRALDAMQGYFIDDDNALSLVTINVAVKDEKESYCDIYVGDKSEPRIYSQLAKIHQKTN